MRFLFLILALILTPPGYAVEQHSNAKLTPIRLQLIWEHQFQFAGFYAAIQQGYYRDVGLDVDVQEFRAGFDVIDEVVSGRAQYGISDASLIINRYKGSPVVLLSNLFQHSPMVLLAHSDSGITSPAQMIGKRIMLSSHELSNASILAMLKHESVSLDQLEVIKHSFNLQDFIDRKVDIISAYVTNEPGVLQLKNIPINIIHPINYGIDFYGNNIFTSEQELADHPNRVKDFITASLKGWEYAISHPEEIIDLILTKYSQRKSRAALHYEAKALKSIILSKHVKLGTIDQFRMERIVETYRELSMLKGDFSLDDFIYTRFPNLLFSDEELTWIRNNREITLGIDPNWAPFEFINEKGEYAGMAADYVRLIAKKAGLKIMVQKHSSWSEVINSAKNRQLDVLPAVMKSTQREQFLDFTTPLINYPMVILTNNEANFIDSLDALSGKKVVVVKNYVTEDILRTNHSTLILVTAKDIEKAISMVSNGEVYAFIDNIATITHQIAKQGIKNLKVSGITKYTFSLSMAVPKGNEILLRILQKTIDSLSDEEINHIRSRWMSADYAHKTDYTLALQITGFAILLLIIFGFWNRRLSGEIFHRKKLQDEERKRQHQVSQFNQRLADFIRDPHYLSGNIADIFNHILPKISAAMAVPRVSIWELNKSHSSIHLLYQWDENNPSPINNITLYKDDYPSYFKSLLADRAILLDDVYSDSRSTELCKDFFPTRKITSMLEAPFHINGRIAGFLCIEHTGIPRKWKIEEEAFIISTTDILSIFYEISSRKKLEATLRSSQKMEALGKLTGGIAHDYNNILGVIIGFADILNTALADQPQLLIYANKIHHAGNRGAKLTKKLLDFSRYKVTSKSILELNSKLTEVNELLEKTLTSRILLEYHLAKDLWTIQVDAADLEDALINLCINAMQSIEGNGHIIIETKNVTGIDSGEEFESSDHVMLKITDTGCGIDDATREKIFDPFFSTKGYKGTGLGLSQVYGFIERSKGTIKVLSKPNVGTTFILYFPRCDAPPEKSSKSESTSKETLGGSETLLLVDDEFELLDLATEILTPLGYKILRANNAQQALKILQQESIDLIFSDIIMPKMNGYELADLVREKYVKTKILLSSGYDDHQTFNKANASLQSNILRKPYDIHILPKRIRELLDE